MCDLEDNNEKLKTVIAFVNKKSGGKLGKKVIKELAKIIGPEHVYDLQVVKPEDILTLEKYSVGCRVIAAGGDGTSAWILSALDKSNTLDKHAMAVLPLGTGNDMAGFLRWGYKYRKRNLTEFVEDVRNGEIISLDRWKITTEPIITTSGMTSSSSLINADDRLTNDVINNYLSVGGDAAIALKFHQDRNNRSFVVRSQISNRFHYLENYFKQLFDPSKLFKSLADDVDLVCDGVQLNSRLHYLKPDTLLFLNIKSYSGGAKPWGNAREISMIPYEKKWLKQKCDDGFIEVIAYTNLELGDIIWGGRGHRLSQCKNITLTTKTPIPVKVDGEPVFLRPCILNVSLKNKALCIKRMRKT